MRKKVHVITLGCSKNTVDSERLLRQMKANRFSITEEPDQADTVIINTCGFIEAAKQESIDTILEAVSLKKEGKLKEVVVAGCLSERYAEELKLDIPEADAFFGTEKYEEILHHLGGELKYELLGERLLTGPTHTAYLKISEGCNHPCSFCAIPLMRGKHVSRPMDDLIREAEFLARNHTKELVIIAQDTTDYGNDLYGEPKLAELLTKLSEIEGIEWIRLMYAYPSKFPDNLIDVIATNPKVLKYIDIPLQHISDPVLKSMRRGISSKRTKELMHKLRKRIPGLVLRTTLITGYPAETEADFEELCAFIEDIKFERLGVFTFSVEENTTSFLLGDPISEKEKLRRKKKLMKIQQQISAAHNEALIGDRLRVMIDRVEGEHYIARSYRDAPEVDGEILIPVGEKKLKTGKFYDVIITGAEDYDLFAHIAKEQP